MFGVKDPIPRVWFKSFYVWAVMLALSVKPLGIYPHVCVRTRSVIGPLTVSDIYQILNNDQCFSTLDRIYFRTPRGSVSARIFEFSTKSDSGIREVAISFLISDYSDSNSRGICLWEKPTENFTRMCFFSFFSGAILQQRRES